MMYIMESNKSKGKKREKSVYFKNVLHRTVILPFNIMGSNMKQNILTELKSNLEGKCSTEGYIKKDSIQIISYSAGCLNSSDVSFEVNFECFICKPVVGMQMKCLVENSTKAGIRALFDSNEKPVTIYIAREQHTNNEEFRKTKENDYILIKVIGIRYQLNDESVSVLAELVQNMGAKKIKVKK